MIIYYSGIRNRHHLSNDRKEHDTLNNIDHLLTIHSRIELRAWLHQIQKFIINTKANKMYGQWHDHVRLCDEHDSL